MLCSNLSTNKEGPSHSEKEWGATKEKHGYGTNGGFEKRDREAAGLFYLNTLQLPETLQKNLDSYLKSKEKGLYLFLLLHEKKEKKKIASVHWSQGANSARAYLGFCSTRLQGILLLPLG